MPSFYFSEHDAIEEDNEQKQKKKKPVEVSIGHAVKAKHTRKKQLDEMEKQLKND